MNRTLFHQDKDVIVVGNGATWGDPKIKKKYSKKNLFSEFPKHFTDYSMRCFENSENFFTDLEIFFTIKFFFNFRIAAEPQKSTNQLKIYFFMC